MRGYSYIFWIDGILLIGGFIFYKVFCRWAFGKKLGIIRQKLEERIGGIVNGCNYTF